MPLVSIAEYARHRGCDEKAVRYAIEGGRITKRPDGLIDSDAADIEWEANTNHSLARYGPKDPEKKKANGHAAAAGLEVSADVPLNGGDHEAKGAHYAKARARTQLYEARLKKLRYEERAGNLVPARDLREAAHQTVTCIRDACLNLPARLAAQLAAETDQDRVFQMLEREIRGIFSDFAEGKLA